MGLVNVNALERSVDLSNQFIEYIYCDSMDDNVLIRKGQKVKNNSNIIEKNNIIVNGSKIVVAPDQFLIVTINGQIVDFAAKDGTYIYDNQTAPSLLYGTFGKKIIDSFEKYGLIFRNNVITPYNYQAYFINTRYIKGNKFGTSNPISFSDNEFGFNIDIRCYGEYVMQITDPIKFYHIYGSNIDTEYAIDNAFKDIFLKDFLQVLPLALSKVAMKKVSYDMLPGAVTEVSKAVNQELDSTWGDQGINVVRVSIESASPIDDNGLVIEDDQENVIKDSNIIKEDLNTLSIDPIAAIFDENNPVQSAKYLKMDNPDNSNGFLEKVDSLANIETRQIKCVNCGSLVRGNFCNECGFKVGEKKYCSNCGKEINKRANFCIECGIKFD